MNFSVDGFDLAAARVIRLRQAIDALLPADDPHARQQIVQLLAPAARQGVDVLPMLRAMLPESALLRRPHGAAPRRQRPPAVHDSALDIEVLRELPRATLWPYRPKPARDELLTSWLWRAASGIGAPPRRFGVEAIGQQLADPDRDIGDAALEQLAFLAGLTRPDLERCTLRPDGDQFTLDARVRAQDLVLRYGDLVLRRSRGGRPATAVVSYCPICLASEDRAFLRRGWRFAFEVACWQDACLLLDACWRCGAIVRPLTSNAPTTVWRCGQCGTALGDAPSLAMEALIAPQQLIYDRIAQAAYTGSHRINPAVIGYLSLLAQSGLRGTNPANCADRAAAVAQAWRQPSYGEPRPAPRPVGKKRSTADAQPQAAPRTRR
jgi:TniQ